MERARKREADKRMKDNRKVTEILSEEHQHILKLAELLEKECSKSGEQLHPDFFRKAVKFIKEYADQFHHGKEEDILFVELNKDGTLTHCNPTSQMLYEHELGREFVREMEEGVKENDKNKIFRGAQGYAQLIKEHIYKEDNILYPMVEEALGEKEKKELSRRFQEADKKNQKLSQEGLKILEQLEEIK